MGKQIGVLGGSFDPIHLGHLNLAVQMMESRGLDEVLFCPAAINPFKQQGSCASDKHRMAMIELAIEGEPRFRMTDIEIKRPGTSYTIDTLRQLTDSQSNKEDPVTYFLIIGDDAASSFHKWKQADEIIKHASLLVGQRSCQSSIDNIQGSPALIAAIKNGFTLIKVFEISSTVLRHRLANRLFCGHLLPGKVLDYILAHNLYLS